MAPKRGGDGLPLFQLFQLSLSEMTESEDSARNVLLLKEEPIRRYKTPLKYICFSALIALTLSLALLAFFAAKKTVNTPISIVTKAVSLDARCGGENSCLGSAFGNCCSVNGWV
jgi:hypothetical protein